MVLVLGAVLPGLVFGIATSWWLARQMQRTAEQEGQAIAAQLGDSVGEHVHLVSSAMKTLARSPSLGEDDL
ncbi:MAG TPA: hypothetical protein VK196_21935, partial [Magnetospirillum sp.]|nr:hypothetical protein [Magnetospirillum sp.]